MFAPELEAGWSLKTFININLYYQGILGMPRSSVDLAITFATTNITTSQKKKEKKKKTKGRCGGDNRSIIPTSGSVLLS